MSKLTTVYTYNGYDIQINLSAPSKGYTINHIRFEGRMFNLVQDAIDAIHKIKGEV